MSINAAAAPASPSAIGGYFSLESRGRAPLHPDGLFVNSGRNALRMLVRHRAISHVHVPYFTCPVVWDALAAEGVTIAYYDLDDAMRPARSFAPDAWVLLNNSFGLLDRDVAAFAREHPRVIVDNAQALYSPAYGAGAIYSPRKFFGLPDGGILVADDLPVPPTEQDHSAGRIGHLARRAEDAPEAGFPEYTAHERALDDAPVRAMSAVTRALFSTVPAQRAAQLRRENFAHLARRLGRHNLLDLPTPDVEVPLCYPLLGGGRALREALIAARVFVPTFWPGVLEVAPPGSRSRRLAEDLVPLPIDQRYGALEMDRVADLVERHLG